MSRPVLLCAAASVEHLELAVAAGVCWPPSAQLSEHLDVTVDWAAAWASGDPEVFFDSWDAARLAGVQLGALFGNQVVAHAAMCGVWSWAHRTAVERAHPGLLEPELDERRSRTLPDDPLAELTGCGLLVDTTDGLASLPRVVGLLWDRLAPLWSAGRRPERLAVVLDGAHMPVPALSVPAAVRHCDRPMLLARMVAAADMRQLAAGVAAASSLTGDVRLLGPLPVRELVDVTPPAALGVHVADAVGRWLVELPVEAREVAAALFRAWEGSFDELASTALDVESLPRLRAA